MFMCFSPWSSTFWTRWITMSFLWGLSRQRLLLTDRAVKTLHDQGWAFCKLKSTPPYKLRWVFKFLTMSHPIALGTGTAVKNVHIELAPEFTGGNGFSVSQGLAAQSGRLARICGWASCSHSSLPPGPTMTPPVWDFFHSQKTPFAFSASPISHL